MAETSFEPSTNIGDGNEPDNYLTDADMEILGFGLMDPYEWAVTHHARLLRATHALRAARTHHEDPSKDIAHSTEADALAGIRGAVAQYLTEVFVMLHSMPIMQRQPEILEALQFIVAGVADIDRGAAPLWLAPERTKRHRKALTQEKDWVPLITAMEILLLHRRFGNIDAAAKELHRLTGRAVGTIKDWHTRLYQKPSSERLEAQATIRLEVSQKRAMLRVMHSLRPEVDQNAIIEMLVKELLP